jgi:hypothetical protein
VPTPARGDESSATFNLLLSVRRPDWHDPLAEMRAEAS